jgi:hypothetical protein
MGRYSPTVLPERGPTLGELLMQGVDAFQTARARRRQEQAAEDTRDADFASKGIFRGHAPAEQPVTLSAMFAEAPSLDSRTAFDERSITGREPSQGMTGNAVSRASNPSPAQRDPFAPATNAELAAALRVAPTSPQFSAPADAPLEDGIDGSAANGGPAVHPGSFDMTTGGFGTNPAQQAALERSPSIAALRSRTPRAPQSVTLGTPGRYRQLNDRYYVDEFATPAGQRERETIGAEDRAAQRHRDDLTFGQQLAKTLRDQERSERIERLVASGYSRQEAELAADNPAIGDDIYRRRTPAQVALKESGVVNPRDGTIEDVYSDGSRKVIRKATSAEIAKATHVGGSQEDRALVQVQQSDGSIVYVPRSQAVGAQAPQRAAVGSASLKKAIATNGTNVSVIDRALQQLKAYPDAVGAKRLIGDFLNQRVDPAGVKARASLANISSLIIHDRSGAAVTAAEFPRLKPFIPTVDDPYDSVVDKLTELRRAIDVETALLEEQLGVTETPAPVRGDGPRTQPPAALTDPVVWLKKNPPARP